MNDTVTKTAGELNVDDMIVNLGNVMRRRDEGAFVYVEVNVFRWSPVTGGRIQTTEILFLHSTEFVEVREVTRTGQPRRPTRYKVEPSITEGEYMVIDNSDPKVANVVFSGTAAECGAWVRDH